MSRLGLTSPGGTFRFDASGLVSPVGHAVIQVAAVGATAVTFRTTAVTPEAGTPPMLVTVTFRLWPAPMRPAGPGADRESHTRDGDTGVYRCPPLGPYQPATSAMRCTSPALLSKLTWPPAPTL